MPGAFLSPFHTTVARRVSLLLIGTVLVPLGGLALLTLHRTTDELEAQARVRLHHDVKAVAMNGVERLALLEIRLRLIGDAALAGDSSIEVMDETFGEQDAAVGFLPDEGVYRSVKGALTPPPLTRDQANRLSSAGSLIARDAHADGTARHWLMVRVAARGRAGTAMAVVDQTQLWGIGTYSTLPPSSELCVFEARVAIACSSGAGPDVARAVAELAPNTGGTVTVEGRAILASTWMVPLKYAYYTEPWTVAMLRPREDVRVPLARFTRDFWLVLILSLLLVTIMSVGQVRRSLRPLAELVSATRRLGARDFDIHVDIRSGDEFQVLGDAVGALAAELKRQFDELEAFNLGTLEALARAIDAKSQWTAGHSERVTALAVELGREMGLSAEELGQLHRGALVHDIGKLGTPSALLNKPGSLTARERQIIEEHPARGVRILEPIAAYAPLLPIVGQHHERWDGSGYPLGLKADEIALPARILAVADAFDAINSNRPYRTGLTLDATVTIIASGSGRLFDPAVVDAFRRVIARQAAA